MSRLSGRRLRLFVGVGLLVIVVSVIGLSQSTALECNFLEADYELPELEADATRFAVIGDYGTGDAAAESVADLVKSWMPDFIVTVGDNNYPDGAAETLDSNISQFYHEFIGNYQGEYGEGAEENRFFPVLGNHDWTPGDLTPYLEYFSLDADELYYTFTWGSVDFFMLDSDYRDPDGITSDSVQAMWLQEQLAASTAPFKVVVMHVAPFSSGHHGSSPVMQWNYAEWGANAILSGHDHTYERILHDEISYFVNGLGGLSIYEFGEVVEGSEVRYNCGRGAMLVEATSTSMVFRFITTEHALVDQYTLDLPQDDNAEG